jgi:hypothetical protein
VPGIRRSRGLYLEILEPATLLDVPIEVDVFSGANPATMLATLDGAFSKRFTRELSELGSGGFSLARTDPKATAGNLAIGNLVKFKVAGTYRHAIWIEEPAATVVSRGEEAGESVAINGRGALAYLERATVYPPVWPPAAAFVAGSSSADNGITGTTSLAVPKPAGAAAGDVAIVGVLCTGALAVTPPGWRRIRDVTEGSLRLAIYVKRLLSYEPASTSWHWAAATKASAAAIVLRNASDDDPSWAIADTTGSGTAIELPSVAVNLVDGVLVTLACSAANTSIAPGAGLTELVDRGTTSRTIELAVIENPALGDTGDLTATAGSSAAWIGVQLSIPSTATAEAAFGGATFGGVLATLIDAAQVRGTLPVLTYDFTTDADSHGEPWPDVHDLSFHIGTSLLDVWRHLVTLGLEGGMTPDLRLQAYVDSSRHFEATVILRKGHHLIGDVVDTAHGSGLRTRMLVEGAGGRILEVTDPVAEADGRIGRREGYLSMSTSDNATTLQRAGDVALASAAAEDQARSIAVVHGPTTSGQFEPWVDYREGDWVGLDADGSGGAAVAQRVASITLEETDAGDFGTELELNSVEMDAFLRLQRRLDALSRSSTASGSGGASGGGGAGGGRVGATSSDTPGYLFDKLDVAAGLTKQLAGDVGVQRVRLAVNAPAIGSGTPTGSKFLRDDGAWALTPGGVAGPADRLWTPPSGHDPYGLSDEFNDGAIDPSWILVNPSPVRATWTEGADVLSCYVAPGNGAGQYNAIMKSLGGRSYPITIESAMRYLTPYAYNYFMQGIIFASGVAWGSGVNVGSEEYTANNLAVSGNFSLHPQPTAYNSDGVRNGQVALQWTGSTIYHKVVWSAANTFSCYVSPDGVSWITVYANLAVTLTPAYVGINTSGWAGGSPCIGSFEYFRVY